MAKKNWNMVRKKTKVIIPKKEAMTYYQIIEANNQMLEDAGFKLGEVWRLIRLARTNKQTALKELKGYVALYKKSRAKDRKGGMFGRTYTSLMDEYTHAIAYVKSGKHMELLEEKQSEAPQQESKSNKRNKKKQYSLYQAEFNAKEYAAVPAFLLNEKEGWFDSSWHNDISPKFENEKLDLLVWIGDKKKEESEYFYRVEKLSQPDVGDQEELFNTDNAKELEEFIKSPSKSPASEISFPKSFQNIYDSLKLIGEGIITFDDYKETFSYHEQRGDKTIIVHGYPNKDGVNSNKLTSYDVRIYDTDKWKNILSSHSLANSTITFVGDPAMADVYENHLLSEDVDFISDYIRKKTSEIKQQQTSTASPAIKHPTRRGEIVKFHSPNEDESPDDRMVVLEMRDDRVLVEHLSTGLSIAPTNVYPVEDLEVTDDVLNPKNPSDQEAVVTEIKKLIRLFIDKCNPKVTPNICRSASSDEGYQMIERAIIKKCSDTGMPVGSAMVEYENDLARAYE